jgi:hypothetical protein
MLPSSPNDDAADIFVCQQGCADNNLAFFVIGALFFQLLVTERYKQLEKKVRHG